MPYGAGRVQGGHIESVGKEDRQCERSEKMYDFEEYFKAGEPGRRERAEAWATAIGLQQVDGLVPSQFLFNTAIEHIEGRITQNQAIPHFARFIAQIWQVHPFGEGNTRTTAVFAIKYLNSLGYRVANNMFKDNSWFFRNALVRANYADYERGVKRDWSYLEAFFRNLLLGENNEMKSRYLLIGLTEDDKRKIRELSEGTRKEGCQEKVVRKRLSENGSVKTADKLLTLLKGQPHLTQEGMARAMGISRQAIQKHLARFKASGRLRRVGPDKGGHWEVV